MADNQPAAPVYTPSGESPQLGAIISELLSEVASTDQLGDAPVRLAEMLDQLLGEPRARELLQCTLEHKNPASVLKRPADNFTEVSAFADDQAEATNRTRSTNRSSGLEACLLAPASRLHLSPPLTLSLTHTHSLTHSLSFSLFLSR